jgi:hypothetical protein
MKRFISILLILITALYVLPVSDGFMADTETTSKCIEKNTDDGKDTKKDNSKEFITAIAALDLSKNCTSAITVQSQLCALPVHFTIETPPPDKV